MPRNQVEERDGADRVVPDNAIVDRPTARPRTEGDEYPGSAGSFRDITERHTAAGPLDYRDCLLHAVTAGSSILVKAESLDQGMPQALAIMGESLQVDRVLVMEERDDRMDAQALRYVWQKAATEKPFDLFAFPASARDLAVLIAWRAQMKDGRPLIAQLATSTGPLRAMLEFFHNQSTLIVPIFVGDRLWGNLGIDSCTVAREWTMSEIDVIKAFGDIAGSLIVHDETRLSLEESEERLRVLGATAADGIIMIGGDGNICSWNRAAERILGYNEAEALGKPVHDFLVPVRFSENASHGLNFFLSTGKGEAIGKTTELAARRKDGTEIAIELSLAGARVGSEWQAIGILRDITERKAQQDKLQFANLLLTTAIEASPDGVLVLDADRRILSFNNRFADMWKIPPQDLVEGTLDTALARATLLLKEPEKFIARLNFVFDHPEQDGEEDYETIDGRLITRYVVTPIPAARAYPGRVWFFRDITESRRAQQSLLESEARFQELILAIREVFWILDMRSKQFLYVSPAYAEIWGRSPSDLYSNSQDWLSMVVEEDRVKVGEIFASSPVQPFEVAFRIRRLDGGIRWLRLRGFPIFDKDGAVVRMAGITADITLARQANQTFVKTQRLLASIVSSSQEAILSLSLDGAITSWNQAAHETFGYSADEVNGKSAGLLFALDRVAESSWIWERVRGGLNIQGFQTVCRHKDGRSITVSLSVSTLDDEAGTTIGASILVHNLSARKNLEDKLTVVSEQLRAVLETTNESVMVLDRDWRITYVSRLPKGEDPATIIGHSFWEYEPAMLGTLFERDYRTAMVERIPCRFEYFYGPLNAWLSGVAYPSEGGLLILSQDVTEKHALDDQFRSAQKMEAIGQLAAGIAHEINTPIQYVGDNASFLKESWQQLASLLAAAQTLREEAATGVVSPATIHSYDTSSKSADLDYLSLEIPRAIDQAIEGVQRVAKIVCAMKEFSHPGSEEKRPVDLNRAIETTLTIARNEWKYVAEVKTHLQPDLPLVPCLGGEINQVLLNLIINAAHAVADVIPEKAGALGTIIISTRQDGDWIELSVQDTGTGIPENAQTKVFDPFFTTKEVGKGTGQGLTLAHTVVVKKHGGRIWFDTEVGRGTTFFVRLPLSTAGRG